jgi:predicted RNA-binding protein
MVISFITLGQDKKEYKDEITGVKVTPPKFTGIIPTLAEPNFESIENYLMKKIQYPDKAIGMAN